MRVWGIAVKRNGKWQWKVRWDRTPEFSIRKNDMDDLYHIGEIVQRLDLPDPVPPPRNPAERPSGDEVWIERVIERIGLRYVDRNYRMPDLDGIRDIIREEAAAKGAEVKIGPSEPLEVDTVEKIKSWHDDEKGAKP